MKSLKHILALGAALLLFGVAEAAQIEGLYRGEVAVADMERAARQAALPKVLGEVLVRVSGQGAVLQDPGIEDVLKRASSYVQTYSYRRDGDKLLLSVSFDPRSVDAALRRHERRPWGAVRPDTLVWVAVEDNGKRMLVGANDRGLVRRVLEQRAAERGLPLSLPSLDQQDQRNIRAADVWGQFHEIISEASRRYRPQAILVGRVYKSGDGWQADWELNNNNRISRWESRGGRVQGVLTSGIDGATDLLAASFVSAPAAVADGMFGMRVEGVDGFEGYMALMTYLQGLNGVSAVQVSGVQGTAVTVRLKAEGGPGGVQRLLALGDVLAPQPALQVPQTGEDAPRPVEALNYRMVQ